MVDVILPVALVFRSAYMILYSVAVFGICVLIPLASVARPILVNEQGSFHEVFLFNVCEAVAFSVFADR